MKKVDHSKKLEEFTEKLKKIPEIIAIYYTGSTAKENWDKYSDMDIDFVVEDKNFEKMRKKLPSFLRMWEDVKFYNNYQGLDETYAYIGKDYLKVELDPKKKSDLKPRLELKDIKIVFDKEGTLTRIYKKSQKLGKAVTYHKEIVNVLLGVRDSQIYAARHYARGEKFSAMSEVSEVRDKLFWVLTRIKEVEDYDLVRKAEKLLSKKEKTLFEKTGCRSANKKEIQRAMMENWKFMKYLEKQYEKKFKRKLNLQCNDKEILKVIDNIYKKAKW